MGLFRKYMSVSTVGLISYRNDSERAAAAERAKVKGYKQRTSAEMSMRERELALREREIAAQEAEAGINLQVPAAPPQAPQSGAQALLSAWKRALDS